MPGKARISWIMVAAATLAAPAAMAQPDAEAFLAEAVQTDLAEVELGKLAQQKAHDAGVREYASMLVSEHQAHMAKARDLATDLRVALPTEPSATAKQTHEQLARLSGTEFEREFVAHMVDGHRMAIEKYQVQTRADDEEVAELAKATLPTLERHLAMAQTLQRGTAVTQSGDDRSDALQRDTERLRQGAQVDEPEDNADVPRRDRGRDR